MFRTISIAIALTVCQQAMAYQEGFYAGGAISLIDSNMDSFSTDEDITFTGFEGQLGYKYDWYLGLDVRVGLSSASNEYDYKNSLTETARSTIDSFASAYYRVEKQNDIAKLYALVGGTTISTTAERESGLEESASDSGLSYGVGVGFTSEDMVWTTNLEYRMLMDFDGGSFGVFSVGVDRRFDFSGKLW